MHTLTRITLCLIMATALHGCAKKNASDSIMVPVSFQQWQQELEKYGSKVLVVDAWATWCESCLERFPHMVSLANKYSDKGVQFVSLNLDDRNSQEEILLANAFIDRMNADFPHYFMDENMMDAFDKLNFMSIPVVLIYDKAGQKRYQLSGDNPNNQFTDEDVEAAVITLLAES